MMMRALGMGVGSGTLTTFRVSLVIFMMRL
jgi:hypothetical protein